LFPHGELLASLVKGCMVQQIRAATRCVSGGSGTDIEVELKNWFKNGANSNSSFVSQFSTA
jgi:hypothetical protein